MCLRESIGLRAIRAFTGDLGNITLSCDLAFLSEVDRESADKILQSDADLTAFLRRFEKIVGITVTDLSWNVGFLGDKSVKRTIEDSFSTFIEWLDTQDIGVVLIPQLFGGQNDRDYLSRFIRDNCLLLSDRYNCNFQQYLISRLYAVVGVRYHCNIFAAKMGIPMIPIVYEQKMKGFLQDSKLESWGIDVYDISGEKIILYFKTLCSEYITRKEYLQKHAKVWKKKARNTIDAIVQIARDQI